MSHDRRALVRARPRLLIAWPVRRGADLRRRHHHAGDLRAQRRRRHEVATDVFKPYRAARRARDPARPVCLQTLRHRRRSAGCSGRSCCCGSSSSACSALFGVVRHPDVLAALDPRYGVGVPGRSMDCAASPCSAACSWRDRRRGAVCRHGPCRPRSDPHRLVRASCCRRCFSTMPGRPRCCSAEPASGQSVLPARARLGAVSAGGAGHPRHHHRQPGDHHRLILDDPSGNAARLVPGHAASGRPRPRNTVRSTSRS